MSFSPLCDDGGPHAGTVHPPAVRGAEYGSVAVMVIVFASHLSQIAKHIGSSRHASVLHATGSGCFYRRSFFYPDSLCLWLSLASCDGSRFVCDFLMKIGTLAHKPFSLPNNPSGENLCNRIRTTLFPNDKLKSIYFKLCNFQTDLLCVVSKSRSGNVTFRKVRLVSHRTTPAMSRRATPSARPSGPPRPRACETGRPPSRAPHRYDTPSPPAPRPRPPTAAHR